MEDAMKDKLSMMEVEAMAAVKGGEAEMLEEMHEDKGLGSDESDSDFDEMDGESEKIMRAMKEQRL